MQQRLLRQVPNGLTLLAGATALLGVGCLASAPILGVALLLLGQLLDALDGYAARRLHACTEFGARLDWSLDVAVCHVLLVGLGLVWLVPVLSAVQARSLTLVPGDHDRKRHRISGRTPLVIITALHILGGL
jgi:phosphatidylglycerophosphate synthase